MNVTCPFCGSPVDPLSRQTLQRITGWQRIAGTRASGKHGGSDILARETVQEWAHPSCVDWLRNGIHPDQDALL